MYWYDYYCSMQIFILRNQHQKVQEECVDLTVLRPRSNVNQVASGCFGVSHANAYAGDIVTVTAPHSVA